MSTSTVSLVIGFCTMITGGCDGNDACCCVGCNARGRDMASALGIDREFKPGGAGGGGGPLPPSVYSGISMSSRLFIVSSSGTGGISVSRSSGASEGFADDLGGTFIAPRGTRSERVGSNGCGGATGGGNSAPVAGAAGGCGG